MSTPTDDGTIPGSTPGLAGGPLPTDANAAGNPQEGEPAQFGTEDDLVKQVFGPDTAVLLLDYSDPRLPPAKRDLWFGSSTQKVPLVDCGPNSKGLCALTIEDDGIRNRFLKANPALAGTLTTTMPPITYIWMRILGFCPENMQLEGLVWISSGFVRVDKFGLPLESPLPFIATTTYDAVIWPKVMQEKVVDDKIIAEYGPFVLDVGAKKRVLNLAAYGRWFSLCLGLKFVTEEQAFYWRSSGEKEFTLVSTAALTNVIITTLTRIAAKDPGKIPLNELRLPRMKMLVEHIKLMAATTMNSAHESLVEYVRARLCLKAGGNVTVEEIHTDYLEYSRQRNLSVYPRGRFRVELPGMVLKTFNLPRINNVQRPEAGTSRLTARRGFQGLAFNTGQTDAKDVQDGSDGAVEPAKIGTGQASTPSEG